ncbi:MAG TPA: cytochrome c [Candidatus Acidoferrales bacterium]|nr:cytochrome c [Candidatus Acidoferrales bacterium]
MKLFYRQTDTSAAQTDSRANLPALVLLAIVLLLFGFPVLKAQQPSDAAPAGNAQNGRKLFLADGCYECHGREGQGAAQTGAARIGPPMLSFEGFQNYIRSPKNQMPPYSAKALPDQDLADIYAFLKSIPMPPKGKDIPLLNK